MTSEREKMQFLSGLLNENGTIKLSKFDELKKRMQEEGPQEKVNGLLRAFESLPSNHEEFVVNKFSAETELDEPIGNIIFKFENNLNTFKNRY